MNTHGAECRGFGGQEELAFRQAVFDWCLRKARQSIDEQAIEEALVWNRLAAGAAGFGCVVLASPELEANLLQVASHLPIPDSKSPARTGRPNRWLHVFTTAFPSSGHTALARRWIQLDPEPNRHSVVLLAQTEPVPNSLVEAVQSSGGDVVRMDPRAPLLERAVRLRELAWREADVVVLHIHPLEVIANVALGVPDGPPVMLVNQAAHMFWVGGSVADVVLNCRVSAQEQEWTVRYRGVGVDRSATLPIPLPEPAWQVVSTEMRAAARAALQLPAGAPVLLTVGDTYKYVPLPGLDFLEAASSILRLRPDAHLLAVGVKENERWRVVREASGGHLRAVGTQYDLKPYHAAADVYLEGFPFGSMTALLEAGLHGLPCVLAPETCPPPFGSDGIAFAGLEKPADVADYVERVVTLLENSSERQQCGGLLTTSIRTHHCGAGWVGYLREVKQNLPRRHQVHPPVEIPPIPMHLASFWSAFSSRRRGDALGLSFRFAIYLGLKPRLDRTLRQAIRSAKHVRNPYAPLNMLITLTDFVVSIVPSRASSFIYDAYDRLARLFREEGRIMRLGHAVSGWFARHPVSTGQCGIERR